MIQVDLAKRLLKSNHRNGTREHRWALRWEDQDGWHCESTGTADRAEAESAQKAKWAELNRLVPPREDSEPEPVAEVVKVTWAECRAARQRAMDADNLRPHTSRTPY